MDVSSENIEIIHEFSTEVRDLLEQLEPSILDLEKVCNNELSQDSPEIIEALNNIFRLFHSVKGSSGFLQLNNITETSHAAENLLERLRSGSLEILPGYIDLLCGACDFIHNALDYLDEHLDDEGMADKANGLIDTFKNILSGEALPPAIELIDDFREPEEPTSEEQPPQVDIEHEPDNLKNPKVVEFFLQEAHELLLTIEEDLLAWIKVPDDKDLMNRLFGNIHSFKGNCGFMNLADPERLSHSMETLLEGVINGLEVDRTVVADLMLSHLTAFREVLDDIADGGKGTILGLNERLAPIKELIGKDEEIEDVTVEGSRPKLGEILIEEGFVSPDELVAVLDTQKTRKPVIRKQDIRVNLDKLDTLITLIGELVIAENMIINNPDLVGLELENFSRSAQQMSKLVNELQEMATSIRLIPVAGIFSRMNRLVHDLARKSNKKIDLQISGESTEVDKSVVENVLDPLTHLIRNSVDHGLETSEERLAAGKPEAGVISLSASHEEGNVMIVIKDDGRGLKREKIIATARKRGLIDGDGSQLTERQIYNLLFEPGFSTAEKITEISGRGVGMDVVQQNLKNIRGSIQIMSTEGKGTTVMLRIPLTMSIIDGMMIRVGKSLFIMPILSIRESICPASDSITITPDGHELVRIRDHLYPIVRLHAVYDLTPDNYDLDQGILVVVEAQGRNVCVFVDEIVGQQQTVIKGLSDFIIKTGNVKGVSGCTILGDGCVCLILDTHALIEMDKIYEIDKTIETHGL